MPGPPPRPSALTELLGNPGKKIANPNEPAPEKGAPKMPTGLTIEARKEWRRVVPVLEKIGMLSVVDRAALVVYCEAWSDYLAASAALRTYGDWIEGTRGTQVRHPAAMAKKEAIATIKAFCLEFGMTPSARSRITLPGQSPEADMESLLSGD